MLETSAVKKPTMVMRAIAPEDNEAIADVIRTVLTEYGCTEQGFAIHDPEMDNMFMAYSRPKTVYFVIEVDGQVVGGAGIAPLAGTNENICEIQKLYILPEYRGRGFGYALLNACLNYARTSDYARCYLETVEKMERAEALYRDFGFEKISMPLGNTGHFKCDRWYLKTM